MLDHLLEDDIEPIADHRFQPTDYPAGSIEKIEVLAYRAQNGLPLWHEHDNPETMPPARELRFGKSQKKIMPGLDQSDICNTINRTSNAQRDAGHELRIDRKMTTRPTTTIEIYVTPTGNFALTQNGKGKRWPTTALGPCDGFATRAEAEQRKSDIETVRWQDTFTRIAVGFDPIG